MDGQHRSAFGRKPVVTTYAMMREVRKALRSLEIETFTQYFITSNINWIAITFDDEQVFISANHREPGPKHYTIQAGDGFKASDGIDAGTDPLRCIAKAVLLAGRIAKVPPGYSL